MSAQRRLMSTCLAEFVLIGRGGDLPAQIRRIWTRTGICMARSWTIFRCFLRRCWLRSRSQCSRRDPADSVGNIEIGSATNIVAGKTRHGSTPRLEHPCSGPSPPDRTLGRPWERSFPQTQFVVPAPTQIMTPEDLSWWRPEAREFKCGPARNAPHLRGEIWAVFRPDLPEGPRSSWLSICAFVSRACFACAA